jgi:hypothetical protein
MIILRFAPFVIRACTRAAQATPLASPAALTKPRPARARLIAINATCARPAIRLGMQKGVVNLALQDFTTTWSIIQSAYLALREHLVQLYRSTV